MVQALRIDLSAEVAGGQMRWMNLNITSLKPNFPYNTIHASYKPPNEQKQKEYANGVDKSVVSQQRYPPLRNRRKMPTVWEYERNV